MPEVRIGGKAAESDGSTGQLKLTMTMRLPFGKGSSTSSQSRKPSAKANTRAAVTYSGDNRPGVTIDQIKREIGTITLDEASDIASSFGNRYEKLLSIALEITAQAPQTHHRKRRLGDIRILD
jgi:hypothetical protein